MFIPRLYGIIKFNFAGNDYGLPIRGIKGKELIKKVPPKNHRASSSKNHFQGHAED